MATEKKTAAEAKGKKKEAEKPVPKVEKKAAEAQKHVKKEEPVKEDFLSRDVRLLYFNAIKRVCHTCCEPENCIEALYKSESVRLPYCPRRTI